MAPLTASVPYNDVAAGPFTISMDSISSGLRSLIRDGVWPPTPMEFDSGPFSTRPRLHPVTPLLIRLCTQHGTLEDHLRAGYALLGRLVRHPPGDRPLLGGARRHHAAEQRDASCDTDQLPNSWNVHRSILIRSEVCTPATPSPPAGDLVSVPRVTA